MTQAINHLLSRAELREFRTTFRSRANKRLNTASDMLLQNLLRGREAKRGFTAVTNNVKLNQGGQHPFYGYNLAVLHLRYLLRSNRNWIRTTFGSFITDQICDQLEQKLKTN